MECDKNFGLLNQRADAKVPADWWKELRVAREKPPPFLAIECEQNLFNGLNNYMIFEKKLKKKDVLIPCQTLSGVSL